MARVSDPPARRARRDDELDMDDGSAPAELLDISIPTGRRSWTMVLLRVRGAEPACSTVRSLRSVLFLCCAASSRSATASTANPPRPVLTLAGHVTSIVNQSSPGSVGNVHGYEDGSVRRVGNVTHALVSELYSDPIWVGMRLAHWRTTALAGDAGWQRVGTLVLDDRPMISTKNCTDKIDHNAALWSPVAYFEDGYWYMTYVAYDCPRNIDGQIKLAKSTVAGLEGIGGTYASVPGGPLLATGPAGGNKSQPWEMQQGDDSFFAFRAPSLSASRSPNVRKKQGELLAFYGSSRFGWPWNVGLASSTTGKIAGPWVRLASNPLLIDNSEAENPIVIAVERPSDRAQVLLMLHDWVLKGRAGYGMTWSVDGRHWANSTMIHVPGGCEAPLGILPSLVADEQLTVWWNLRNRFDGLFAAQFALSWV